MNLLNTEILVQQNIATDIFLRSTSVYNENRVNLTSKIVNTGYQLHKKYNITMSFTL